MAAAFSPESETEDFVTCSVCLCEFDSEIRKPKFLPCSHTLCLECLKEIHSQGSLTCPLCRKVSSHSGNVSSLPNNPYALHILKLKQQKPPPTKSDDHKPHVLTSTVKDFADFLQLKKELEEVKKESQLKLNQASSQRKKIGQHLDDLEDYFLKAKNEITALKNVNKIELDAIETQLFKFKEKEGDDDPSSLSDLVALVSDAEQGDTLATLRDKMKKNLKLSQNRLQEANSLANYWENLRKPGRVTVSTAGSLCDQMEHSLYPAFPVLYLMKREAINVLSNNISGFYEPQATVLDNRPIERPIKRFHTLILGVKQEDSYFGEVSIKLNPKFAPNFVQKWGESCYKSPRFIGDSVSKAIPGIFVLLPLYNLDHFQTDSNVKQSDKKNCKELACYNADVGIYMNGSWSLLFPLNYFNAPESLKHVEPLAPAQLLGRVTSGMHLIVMLTKKKYGFTFTLEAR